MDKDIDSTLKRLDLTIGRGANCHFNNPASYADIEAFEKRHRLRLPLSYKQFLEYTNGGMILSDKLEKIRKQDNGLETAKWNAHYLLSLEELEEKYTDMESWNFGGAELPEGPYPFIPFFRTSVNEYLVFVSLADDKKESPVFDAFHEEPVHSWGLVAAHFNEFLNNYLDTHGQPKVIGDVAKGGASDFISIKTGEETPKEIIDRTTKRLTVHPDDHWAYMERGMAYFTQKNTMAALKDYNKSIDLAACDPFYYFKRGELYRDAGKIRAALIDIDIAVKLKPDDTLYLSLRAEALQKMKKYKTALKDVNKVIEIDSTDMLAYMIREEIYRSLGETEKAAKDAERIKELEEDR